MEKDIVPKLIDMQNAHNEMGRLFGQLALHLKDLNQFYLEQNEYIDTLKGTITTQRNFIRNFGQNNVDLPNESLNLDIILSKSSKFLRIILD